MTDRLNMYEKREELSEGVTRIRLTPAASEAFEPIIFSDAGGEYLRQTGFEASPRPIYQLGVSLGEGKVKQTANGEVAVFEEGECAQVRVSHSALSVPQARC